MANDRHLKKKKLFTCFVLLELNTMNTSINQQVTIYATVVMVTSLNIALLFLFLIMLWWCVFSVTMVYVEYNCALLYCGRMWFLLFEHRWVPHSHCMHWRGEVFELSQNIFLNNTVWNETSPRHLKFVMQGPVNDSQTRLQCNNTAVETKTKQWRFSCRLEK